MKLWIGRGIAILAAFVFVVGIAACIGTYVSNNPKQHAVSATSGYNLAKDGRQIVNYVVTDDEADRYVKSTKAENINQVEYYRRLVKNRRILVEIAKRTYEADMTDTNLTAYNTAVANLRVVRAQQSAINSANFVRTITVFFGTYMPIIAILGIAFLINLKMDYGKAKA